MVSKPDLIHSSLWGGDLESFIIQSNARGLFRNKTVFLSAADHVLPTLGSAKFSSGLNINEFIKKVSVVTLTKLGVEKIGNHAITLSEFEQLNGHTQSIKSRIRRK